MANTFLTDVRKAITNLSPHEVRAMAERPVNIGLVAPTAEGLWRMESYFCPPALSPGKRAEVARMLHRISSNERTRSYDIEFWDDSLACPEHVVPFDADDPERAVKEAIDRRPELAVPLARHFAPFRRPVTKHLISTVCKENALFALATGLPDVVPNLISLPWALGEFASDTAFITVNQIRMTFLLAAASDRAIGYREQRTEIGSIVASAFGFRALARELVGKIPFGAGLLPKAAIAFAGTYVIGHSMERLYRIGYGYSRHERKAVYSEAFERGKQVAGLLLDGIRKPSAAES
jgi:hypothetical protein